MKKFGVILGILAILVLMAVPAFAVNVGNNMNLDVSLTTGKLWNVHQNDVPGQLQYVFTTQKAQWNVSGEVGLTIPTLTNISTRPFFRYSTLTNVYEEKEGGVDFLYDVTNNGGVGLRMSYIAHRNSGMPTEKMLYTGLTFQLR